MRREKKLTKRAYKQGAAMLMAALLCGCGAQKPWSFKTDYFGIQLNDKGYITSMKNITVKPYREFCPADKPSPLLSLYDSQSKVYYQPEQADYDKRAGIITLTYTQGQVAKVKLTPKDKYLKLTLQSLDNRGGVDAIQWGDYYTNINNLLGEIIASEEKVILW